MARRERRTPVREQLDPEEQVIARCIRSHLDTGGPDAGVLPSDRDVDWERFDRVANGHHVRPLVYRVLLDDHTASLPADAVERWRSYVDRNTRLNLHQTGELVRILDEFDERGVPALPFKGPVLAGAAYGDISLREFVDLDIIVDGDSYSQSREVLRDRGYEVRHKTLSGDRLTSVQETLIVEFGREAEFVHESDSLAVDLHWRFLPRRSAFPVAFEDAESRRESVAVAGSTLPALSTTDALLLLAVHGTRHCWRHLRETCDLAALVRAQDVDWEGVVRRAEEGGCRRRLGVGLQLARELLNCPVPESVVSRVIGADPAVATLVRGARDRLFGAAGRSTSGTLGYKYRAHERRRDRVAFLLKWGFYPQRKDIESVALPARLSPLYHAVRPVRLLTDGYGGLR